MLMIKYGVSILIMRLIFTKKISATRVEPSHLVPFSVRLRLLELIFSFVIINHFLIIQTYHYYELSTHYMLALLV